MDRIVERCCGLDVHKSSVTACVRITEEGGRVRQITEEFAATTQGLLLLRDWLASFEVELVGMENERPHPRLRGEHPSIIM